MTINSQDPDILALFGEEGADQDIVSTFDAPEVASAASAAALADPVPQIEEAPPGVVQLPAGYLDPETGDVIRTALVRELTGRDEERLARIDMVDNMPAFFQTLTECGVERIGNEPATKEMLKGLLLGDREALVLGIRIATYGPGIEMHMTCPFCGAEEDLVFELDKDIPVKTMETPEKREYEVVLRDGRVAVITPVTVETYDKVWDPKKNAAEIKTATLERCVLSIDGRPVGKPTIQDLGLADRKTLLLALNDLQPGPDYEGVGLDCETCAKTVPINLNLADLFR